HKLGINASPTCVMSYGDSGECIGELVGQENRGLAAMFTMMNNARINVGNQGNQIAERATQQALYYAMDRVQSARAGSPDKSPVAIIEHPDVRRMLLRMKALTEGVRALLYFCAGQVDRGTIGDEAAKMRSDILVPLLKAWGTDVGVEVSGIGIQIHGGMGFVEETGAAQHWRDSRIAPIYEGTNGIQAADLVTRKLGLDGGEAMIALFDDIAKDAAGEATLAALATECANIARWMRDEASLDDRLAGSVPFCTMAAVAVAGWQLMKQGEAVSAGAAPALAETKPVTVRFFLDRIVPEALGQKAGAIGGADLLYTLPAEKLAG
ncbi:MAG: acyl-CoA dehydrogenase, partial [Pseudomonadota bacterium]